MPCTTGLTLKNPLDPAPAPPVGPPMTDCCPLAAGVVGPMLNDISAAPPRFGVCDSQNCSQSPCPGPVSLISSFCVAPAESGTGIRTCVLYSTPEAMENRPVPRP